jgi:hypothetical protein
MTFTAPNFAKLTFAEQHYVEISCTKFHQCLSISMESVGKNLFTPLSKVTQLIFMKLALAEQFCVKNSYTKLHEKPTEISFCYCVIGE